MQVPAAELRRIAESPNPRAALRALLERRPPPAPRPQLALWVRDADDLPERPWRIRADDRFDCKVLGCKGLRAGVCVARQVASDIQRTQQSCRGQGAEYPSCQTHLCAQGRGIREALDPLADVTWEGRDARRGGFHREQARRGGHRVAQLAARERLERAGLLDEVRVLDIHADPVERDGEED